ncbi:MAG: prephenate dehydrogenase [Rikenellaceae bacterium]
MTIYIIGIGLIGGSLAISMRENGLADKIIGYDASKENLQKALELGLIDSAADMKEGVAAADLIVLAAPVDITPSIALEVLDLVNEKQCVIDMGSIKEGLCEAIANHPMRSQFVATHPMWGTENSGPEAAQKDAFKGRTVVICEAEKSAPDAVKLVEKIYQTIGMPISYMNAEEHDLHVAYVSHISHITSFALALTVLEKEREDHHIFDLAGGGFESTVRLAKSASSTWIPILTLNKNNVLDVLGEHIKQLEAMQNAIKNDDRATLNEMMSRANTIKRIIK